VPVPLYRSRRNSASNNTLTIYTHVPNYIRICVLCHLLGSKKCYLGKFWHWGADILSPLYRKGQIWCARADQRSTLTCRISSPLVYSVTLWQQKTSNFAISWSSAFFGVTSWRQSEKVEHRCTTTDLPLSIGIKNRFCTPTPSWRNWAHNLWRSKAWRTDRPTDKLTRKLNVFHCPGGGWNWSPTKLGMVIEDL